MEAKPDSDNEERCTECGRTAGHFRHCSQSTEKHAGTDDDIFVVEEVAFELRLKDLGFSDPVKTVKRWVTDGKIGSKRVGHGSLITRRDIKEFLSRKKSEGEPVDTKPRRRRRSHNRGEAK